MIRDAMFMNGNAEIPGQNLENQVFAHFDGRAIKLTYTPQFGNKSVK